MKSRGCWRRTEPSISPGAQDYQPFIVNWQRQDQGNASSRGTAELAVLISLWTQGCSHEKQDAQMLPGSQCFGAPTDVLPRMGRILDLPG